TATLRDQDGSAFTTAPAGVEVVWSSAASSIATVSQTGLVQGTGPGTARITAAAAGRSAFVDVTVTSANTAPVAVDDSVTLVQGTSLDIDVVANDSDADGDDLTPSILTQPVHGAAMLQGGAIRYTPDVGYVGVDQF